MKKLLNLLMVFFFVSAMVACGGGEAEAPEETVDTTATQDEAPTVDTTATDTTATEDAAEH
jgi:predicted small lipoprotein YifL